jgi:hypothetical protein
MPVLQAHRQLAPGGKTRVNDETPAQIITFNYSGYIARNENCLINQTFKHNYIVGLQEYGSVTDLADQH